MLRDDFYFMLCEKVDNELNNYKKHFKTREDVEDCADKFIYEDYLQQLESALDQIVDEYCYANDYFDEEADEQ